MDELNRKREWALSATALISRLSFVTIDNRMLKIITSIFIVTRRLEKHSILKFNFFKLLGHGNIFTLLSFF